MRRFSFKRKGKGKGLLIAAAVGAGAGALLTALAGAARGVPFTEAIPKNAIVGAIATVGATFLGAPLPAAALAAGTGIYLVNTLGAAVLPATGAAT